MPAARRPPAAKGSAPRDPAPNTPAPNTPAPNTPAPRTVAAAAPAVLENDPTPSTALAPPLFGVLVLASLVIAGAGLRSVSQIVGPVFLVLTLVITVHPLRTFLTRHKVPAPIASVVAMLSMYALLAAVIGSVVLSLTKLVEVLPNYASAFTSLYTRALAELAKLGISSSVLQNAVSQVNLTSFTGLAQTLLNTVTSGLSLLALMLAMVVFLAFDAAGISDRIALIRDRRPHIADALTEFAQSVRKYWIVTTVFGLIVAIIDVAALYAIGVPLAITWGVLAFVTNYIPNVGFLIGLVPPALIALLDGGVGTALAVIIAYCLINVVVQTLIQPRFTGDAVGITATVAFLSLIFWAYMLGALGALLAVPATLLVKALLVDHSLSSSWFGALINSTPEGGDEKRRGRRR